MLNRRLAKTPLKADGMHQPIQYTAQPRIRADLGGSGFQKGFLGFLEVAFLAIGHLWGLRESLVWVF